jgi:peptide subunit release factor 1 (eRF1)
VEEPGLTEDLTGREEAWRDELVEHALRERTVGVLLVRLGGHAAGVFRGDRLVASKVGSRHVQGRTAAGGWSQQRFARRRAGQAAVAHSAAADDAARVLLGHTLDALVVGGDRSAVDSVLADRRLAPLVPLVTGRVLAVPDPRLKVLQECRFRDVWIRVTEP